MRGYRRLRSEVAPEPDGERTVNDTCFGVNLLTGCTDLVPRLPPDAKLLAAEMN
jgi:hypothetical protein